MANYEKRGASWRVRLYVNGRRDSGTFPSKAEAIAWATRREAELVGVALPDKTLKDALRRYANEVSPTHRGEQWEVVRLKTLERAGMAKLRLSAVTATDIAEWRDMRLRDVSGASVAREMNLLKSVLDHARREWGGLRVNPASEVRRPSSPPSRKRRVTADEIDRLSLGFGLGAGYATEAATNRVGLAFLFALETAMRAGEITGMVWADVSPKTVRLPVTKNGDTREVPLTIKARAILEALRTEPLTDPVFRLEPAARDALFRKVRDRCKLQGLHFHDSRSEAVWRLSKKLDVMELARIIGHRDLRSLMLYYNADASELADRLG